MVAFEIYAKTEYNIIKTAYSFNWLPWSFTGSSHWEVFFEINLNQKTLKFYTSWAQWKNQWRLTVRKHVLLWNNLEYQHSAIYAIIKKVHFSQLVVFKIYAIIKTVFKIYAIIKTVYGFIWLPWAFTWSSHWEVFLEINLNQKTLKFCIIPLEHIERTSAGWLLESMFCYGTSLNINILLTYLLKKS